MTIFKYIRKHRIGRICLPVLLLLLAFSVSGCSQKSDAETNKKTDVNDSIEGFLFSFDQRAQVKALLSYNKRRENPVSVTWEYKNSGSTDDSAREKANSSVTSEDPDTINDIYLALSNTIILGVAKDQATVKPQYYISFTLPDGEECRFDFITENTIRLSNQNYVAETDMDLWALLS